MTLTQEQSEKLKRSVDSAFGRAEFDPGMFDRMLGQLSIDARPLARIFGKVFKELAALKQLPVDPANPQSGPQVYAFFKDLFLEVLVDINWGRRFDVEKALVIFAVVGPEVKPSELRYLHDLMLALKGEIDYPVLEFTNTFLLLLDLLRKQRRIAEVRGILEEIRTIALGYAARYCLDGNLQNRKTAVEMLSSLLLKRIYNAMYWYVYGKQ